MDRRTLLRLASFAALAPAFGGWAGRALTARASQASPAAFAPVAELAIDLTTEPPTLDPATAYDADAWSVVHAIHDSLLQYAPDGALEPLLAERFGLLDPLTYEVVLRPGITFHDGTPLDAAAITASVARIVDPATASQVADLFKVIERVEEVDVLTARLRLARPAPWLPAQIAAWLAVVPPGAADPANAPVGTGPYRFVEWRRGEAIVLEANPDYFAASPKGRPVAERADYRFVPEGSTRVADLLSGTAGIVRAVPVDQVEAVRGGGAEVLARPISGSVWVRIPTDVAPFNDVRVRQALNYAVDVQAIIAGLQGGEGERLAGFFPEGSLAFDPALAPYEHDPARAVALLTEAGYGDGFETSMAYANADQAALAAAIAGQLAEVGVRVETEAVETATFNATWKDPASAPLRLVTWRPLFDPYTLLDLLVSETGFLSRHANATAQPLIAAAAAEPDAAVRAETYRRLSGVLREEPAAIYLSNLTARYGVAAEAPAWTPRPDDYIIPTFRG